MKTGIIPCGGKATRFDGVPKWALPCGPNGMTFLRRAALQLVHAGAERIILSTSPEQYEAQTRHLSGLGRRGVPVGIFLTNGGLADAIVGPLFDMKGDVIMAMGDTYFPRPRFVQDGMQFAAGMFRTHRPERFGVWDRGNLLFRDKHPLERKPRGWDAWGVLSWSETVSRLMLECHEPRIITFNSVINTAIRQVMAGAYFYGLPYYYDMASLDDYLGFVKERLINA